MGLVCFSIIAFLLLYLFLPKYIAGLIASPEIRPLVNLDNLRNQNRPRIRRRGIVDTYNIAIFFLVFTVGTCIAVIQRWLKTEETRKETESQN